MSDRGLVRAQQKMRDAGVAPTAITVFSHYYRQLEKGATGLIGEDTIDPVVDLPHLDDIEVNDADAAHTLDQTVVIRLNGGLGTSMGMDRAKSLLPVRDGKSFLQIIVEQLRHARAATGARLPLLLMNSFRTRDDCRRVLEAYPDLTVAGLPLDFVQNAEPKLLVDSLEPAEWPADPSLEWCPPGHGDIYTSLLDTGLLEMLLEQGFHYAMSANGDNLGATPDPRIAAWFAASGAPYAAEVCLRTPSDRKGGHLVRRKGDGRLILRETAQTAPEEMRHFTDESRHPYAHTNNLWFDLGVLHETLVRREGVLGLPLIRNEKTLDPADPDSPRVYQLETALGAAVEAFPGATAIVVGRDRFLPVKTTNDLLAMRSDAYEMGADHIPRLRGEVAPLVDLDPRFYKRVADFDARFPAGPPSLAEATELQVRGDWTFGAGVAVRGDVFLHDEGAKRVADGTVLA